jgi:hypothetical protein
MTAVTITTSSTGGYFISNTATNPVTVASGVTISTVNFPALGTTLTSYWSIVNSGTLLSTWANPIGDGILLYGSGNGGAVTNTAGGSITGYSVGISVAASGTVVNQGTITTTGTSGTGYNYVAGTFTATSAGVVLGGGGVSNAGTGLISGYFEGVAVGGGGSVVNAGTISAANASYGFGVVLAADGSVTNAQGGIISGGADGILTVEPASTVINQGYIRGVNAIGVDLFAGGVVTNASTGTISGGAYGIRASDPASTVINQGYIGGIRNIGVGLYAGGTVNNASTGDIYGSHSGIQALGTSALAVSNAADGTIAGHRYGMVAANGNVASVSNAGIIIGYSVAGAIVLDGGTIDNEALGRFAGGRDGIYSGGTAPATITNAGVVYGLGFAGVWLNAGGSLTNTGTVFGYYFGVKVSTAPGTVVNEGSISDSVTKAGAGVQLADGGVVTNAAGGTITSNWMGVQIGASTTASVGGTVVNQGTILAADVYGDGAGLWIHGPGAITNAAGGLISGGAFGIVTYYQTTVVNQGTVFGTEFAFDAVHSGFADRIIDAPGAVFSGTVSGGNTLGSAIYSTLELASGSSTGTIANIGTFVDFGQIALDAGASWSLGGSLVAGETVAFGGAGASLILATPSAAAATIAGFAAIDTIVLSGITDVTGLSFSGDTLSVSESGDAGMTLQFTAPQNLTYAVADGSTDIFVVPCFLPGTHILTDRGEVLVEKLRVGDSIVTASGGTRPLCWIGQGRALATRGRRGSATPVIVRKGALADNVPHRDLHITKGHSLYLDGVLIPVEFLVNHRSILWDDRAQEVTVFHLELDAHDVLIANGVASESYRDDGNRWLFQNANAGWDQPAKPPFAPVLTGGAQVDAIWQRILDRAGPRPGLPLTDDPDLHLLVDGVRVDAAEQQGLVRVFRLSRRPGTVRIASREAVPAELGLARDARSLGVALRRIAVRQGTRFVVLDAGDGRLADGFHAHEAATNLRWTDGCATLPAEAFARFEGGVEVVLHVAETTLYPNEGAGAARAAA